MWGSPPAAKAGQITISKPDWGDKVIAEKAKDTAHEKIKSTWLGHACFLVELPLRSTTSERGVRILFDPVFSDRCSPSQYMGPKRFTRKSYPIYIDG